MHFNWATSPGCPDFQEYVGGHELSGGLLSDEQYDQRRFILDVAGIEPIGEDPAKPQTKTARPGPSQKCFDALRYTSARVCEGRELHTAGIPPVCK
jgi:hypothetical protein